MKHKNQKRVCQSINPFLGFGWNTGSKLKKQQLHLKPRNVFKVLNE